MMKRKNFLKNICGYGLCSCMGMPLFTEDKIKDQSFSNSKNDEWKKNFLNERFNWLLQIMEKEINNEEYQKIIQQLGSKCAETIKHIAIENKGNPEGYFSKINSMWGEVFEFDKEKQTIYLNTNLSECPCAVVNKDVTPGSFCNCSLGWQKHMFEIVFNKPVEVIHKETILRGGKTCRFEIKIKS